MISTTTTKMQDNFKCDSSHNTTNMCLLNVRMIFASTSEETFTFDIDQIGKNTNMWKQKGKKQSFLLLLCAFTAKRRRSAVSNIKLIRVSNANSSSNLNANISNQWTRQQLSSQMFGRFWNRMCCWAPFYSYRRSPTLSIVPTHRTKSIYSLRNEPVNCRTKTKK